MDRRVEHQLIEQLREVSEAADKVLAFFPNRTDVAEIEQLRHKMLILKEQLYCDVCGVDQLLHPNHIGQCPHCKGSFHYHADRGTCARCGYTQELEWPESLAMSQED